MRNKAVLNLEDVEKNIQQLAQKYHLCVVSKHYVLDGDMEDLFYDSGIRIGEVLHRTKDWVYDEDTGYLDNCKAGDYLETIELIQQGKVYLCQVFSEFCGSGLEYTLALCNVYSSR